MPEPSPEHLALLYEALYSFALDVAALAEQRLEAVVDVLNERERQLTLPIADPRPETSADMRGF